MEIDYDSQHCLESIDVEDAKCDVFLMQQMKQYWDNKKAKGFTIQLKHGQFIDALYTWLKNNWDRAAQAMMKNGKLDSNQVSSSEWMSVLGYDVFLSVQWLGLEEGQVENNQHWSATTTTKVSKASTEPTIAKTKTTKTTREDEQMDEKTIEKTQQEKKKIKLNLKTTLKSDWKITKKAFVALASETSEIIEKEFYKTKEFQNNNKETRYKALYTFVSRCFDNQAFRRRVFPIYCMSVHVGNLILNRFKLS
jgi:hypothetical protein